MIGVSQYPFDGTSGISPSATCNTCKYIQSEIKKIDKAKSNTVLVIYPWPPHSKFLTECSHPFVRILQCFTHRWHSLAGTQSMLNPQQK